MRCALREAAGERTFGLWLEPLRCLRCDGETLLLAGPPEITTWASDRLGGLLATCAAAAFGPGVSVELTSAAGAPAQRPSSIRRSTVPPAGRESTPEPPPTCTTNPAYTFENFVIGESNRLAHAAALSVAELPAQAYNPLFIYGPPGLGKTHLLHSIANYVRTFGGGLSVHYTTIETFTNDFVSALSGGSIAAFKQRVRGADVLLIDDVQFLERKARTEEELFHTFNALYESGSQLVLTSDRLPSDLGQLEERLRERFESGLVTDITHPDYATRLAILTRRAALDNAVDFDAEALALIAGSVESSVRALEGALIRVTAYASLTARPVTPDLAEEVLRRLAPRKRRRTAPTIEAIQTAAATHFGLTREDLLSRSRAANVTWARQAAMYVARELTSHSLPTIASEFGGRDHTTVLHACRRVTTRITTDPDGYSAIEQITASLTDPTSSSPEALC